MREAVIRKKAIRILTEENWIYWYPSKVKYKQNDIFGVFDLICWQKKTTNIKFVQLTTLPNLSARKKKIKNFLKKNKLSKQAVVDIEVWAWNKRDKVFKTVKII